MRPNSNPTVHCQSTVIKNHSLNPSPALLLCFKATIPIYRKGKETPSLQALSAERRFFNRPGTLSLNRDFASTLAASTGSVGDRQAPMIKADGMLVLKMKYAKREVIAHENVMIGPRK